MDTGQLATRHFGAGFNCAEAVLLAAIETNLTTLSKTEVRAATPFGGGMGCQEVCGAVTGALIALGFALGRSQSSQARDQVKAGAQLITSGFSQRFGALTCRDLLRDKDCDQRKPLCQEFVKTAANLLAEALKNSSEPEASL